MQEILDTKDNYKELEEYFKNNQYKKIFIVCSHHFYNSKLYSRLCELGKELSFEIICFDEFEPNPKYESVCVGLDEFKKNNCDFIMAIGGGSAIDVAKCIKLFANMNSDENYLKQEIVPNDIPFMAVPTTAGTGSEATHFAVIYYNGEKQSVADMSSIPELVLFDPSFLESLPTYQKKSTVFDAYCHAIESMWSKKSNDESIGYSIEAINLLRDNMDDYFLNREDTYSKVLEAANLAGKAINLTTTTAGHAMCYKLTSLYGISHGHAALLVNSELYPYMIEHLDKCNDPRGEDYLKDCLTNISRLLGYDSLEESKNHFRDLLRNNDLYDVDINSNDMDTLVSSVNVQRLSNNPVKLDEEDIREIYNRIINAVVEEKNESNRICK